MKSLFAALCLAFAVGGGFAAPEPAVAAAAQARPWTKADIDELQAVANNHLLPLIDSVNTAVKLMTTDQKAACASAQKAQVQMDGALNAVAALNTRIQAEGKDMAPLAQVNEKTHDLKTKIPEMVDAICNNDITQMGDPEQQAELSKIMGFVQQYSSAMNEATKALAARDQPRACARLTEARTALNGLEAYLAELKVKYREDTAGVAEIDKLNGQIREWRAQIAEHLAACPVT